MKFVRFQEERHTPVRTGVCQENGVIREITGNPLAAWEFTENLFQANDVILKAPIEPRNIIGIGKNYLAPGEQRPETLPAIPVFFLKPAASAIATEEHIILPPATEEVKFEAELAVIIGKQAKAISVDEVPDYIFGYTVGNDVTAPSLFHPDGHWTIGKAADTFTPLGPVIETKLDLSSIKIRSLLNGEEKQNSGLENIIVGIPEMISFISQYATLFPGDVILTGAPAGAVMMKAGDIIECIVDGIGTLRNTVAKND